MKDETKAHRWDKIKEALKGKTVPGSEEEKSLHRCMKNHQGVVLLEGEPFKTTQTVKHHIDYHGPPDLFVPQYKIAQIDIEDTEEEMKRLETELHIRRSKSGFNFPIIPVRKKGGSLRVVHDYRLLNKYTRKQRFPLPRIDQILASLKGAKYFVVLDLKSAYFQVELTEQSKRLTAFRTSTGCWEYNKMPYGISNAPSTMQRLMLQVTNGLVNTNVFLDDVLIHGKTLLECEANLDRVLRRLSEHNLTIALEKCSFFKKQCTYLGHIISEDGISPDPSKVSAVKEYPTPKDLHDVRSFLGLASYYRKFIPAYSQIAAPLHALTKGYPRKGKRIKIEWAENEERAFQELKEALTYNVTLMYPDFQKPFLLTCDASDTSIGGCLSQLDDEGRDRPITFYSKKLLDAETRYDAISREALAVIHGLKVNRQYILGREVNILSDNKPLVWMLTAAVPSQRVARWQIILSEYDIVNIKHLAGSSNVVADALSRHVASEDTVDKLLDEIPYLNVIKRGQANEILWDVEKIAGEQDTVSLYKELKKYLKGERAMVPRYLAAPINQFELDGDILFFKSKNEYGKIQFRTCLPPAYVDKALELAHNIPVSGHTGINGTIEKLKTFAYWPTMSRDAKSYVKLCEVCLKTKPHRGARAPMLRNPEVHKTWDRLNLDLIGPLPVSDDNNRYILSVVDVFSRFGMAIALPDKSVTTVSRAMINHIIGPFGPPRSVYSDQGTEFTGAVLHEVLRAMGVYQRHITAYRPQASGIVERFNGHLVAILRALVYEHPGTWDITLPLATLAYNTSYHRIIRETPYFLFYLRDAYVPFKTILDTPGPFYSVDSMKHEMLLRAHTTFTLAKRFTEEGRDTQEQYANKDRKLRQIEVSDRVYVKKMANVGKLGDKYAGPMRVIKKLGVIFWVKDLLTSKIYKVHIDRLKLEQVVVRAEAEHIREAYPVEGSSIDREYERVTNRELTEAGLSGATLDQTVAEGFLNKEIRIPEEESNSPVVNRLNQAGDSEEVVLQADHDENNHERDTQPEDIMIISPDVHMTYPLRNRGGTVADEDWVMTRPIE